MGNDSRYIVLSVDWDEGDFTFSLSEGSQLAWIKLVCQVRRDCTMRNPGRAKRMSPLVASRKWGVGEESVVKMEKAAELAGELKIEDGDWIITDWNRFQSNETLRKQEWRKGRKNIVPDSHGQSRTATDGDAGIGIGIVDKEITTNVVTKKVFAPPSTAECREYAKQINLPESEGCAFHDYWTSMDWKRKAGPMKDWQASLRLWKSNWQKNQKVNPGTALKRVRSVDEVRVV